MSCGHQVMRHHGSWQCQPAAWLKLHVQQVPAPPSPAPPSSAAFGCDFAAGGKETMPFHCAFAAVPPFCCRLDAFGSDAAAGGEAALPVLALALPFCRRLMPVPRKVLGEEIVVVDCNATHDANHVARECTMKGTTFSAFCRASATKGTTFSAFRRASATTGTTLSAFRRAFKVPTASFSLLAAHPRHQRDYAALSNRPACHLFETHACRFLTNRGADFGRSLTTAVANLCL